MPIGLGELFVCIKFRGHVWRSAGAHALPSPIRQPLGRLHCVFIHEIHWLTSCPCTNWQIDFLAGFALKGPQIRNGNGLHFDEAARVEGFDLEDFSFWDDFTGFTVGSATNSGSCAEEALEDEHDSTSGWLERAENISDICGPKEEIIPSRALLVALEEACEFATY